MGISDDANTVETLQRDMRNTFGELHSTSVYFHCLSMALHLPSVGAKQIIFCLNSCQAVKGPALPTHTFPLQWWVLEKHTHWMIVDWISFSPYCSRHGILFWVILYLKAGIRELHCPCYCVSVLKLWFLWLSHRLAAQAAEQTSYIPRFMWVWLSCCHHCAYWVCTLHWGCTQVCVSW